MPKLTKTQDFYKGKSIFVTGASGFMGKVLLEKLLYSCSDVKEIMILVRPKRGKSAAQRVQDFATLPVSFIIVFSEHCAQRKASLKFSWIFQLIENRTPWALRNFNYFSYIKCNCVFRRNKKIVHAELWSRLDGWEMFSCIPLFDGDFWLNLDCRCFFG